MRIHACNDVNVVEVVPSWRCFYMLCIRYGIKVQPNENVSELLVTQEVDWSCHADSIWRPQTVIQVWLHTEEALISHLLNSVTFYWQSEWTLHLECISNNVASHLGDINSAIIEHFLKQRSLFS